MAEKHTNGERGGNGQYEANVSVAGQHGIGRAAELNVSTHLSSISATRGPQTVTLGKARVKNRETLELAQAGRASKAVGCGGSKVVEGG